MSSRPPARGDLRERRGGAPLALLLALANGACGDAPEAEQYFPLAAGMHWQYRVLRTTMDGPHEQRHVVSSRPPERRDDGPAAVRESGDGQRQFYRRTASGIERLGDGANDAGELILPARLAPQARWRGATVTSVLESSGPPWETPFRISAPVTLDYAITSLAASVVTPAGRFERCVIVRGSGRALAEVGLAIGSAEIAIETTAWYAPDVGLVRFEREERSSASALAQGRLVVELDRWRRE